ncbi:CLUMA_CG004246, isoform A [Clunio marinus]|uniref:CLUMA_CG004246, isoform A n=1 Tax=Clunio marinus TaxID=568069 RepID=A0A1J1HVL5_9DIPT|nr:CLUMA_CG004246, isoform A [Clunio marinus]
MLCRVDKFERKDWNYRAISLTVSASFYREEIKKREIETQSNSFTVQIHIWVACLNCKENPMNT